MNNGSKSSSLEEKKKWAMKYFDYAESTVKEWIADFLEEDPNCLFDEYNEETDVISTKENNKIYTFYLSTTEETKTPNFNITEEELKSSEKIRKAASVMYDSVYTTYGPIVKTMINSGYKMENIFPEFVENGMYFRFSMFNNLEVKKNNATSQLLQIGEQIKKINGKEGEEFEKIRSQLVGIQNEQLNIANGILDNDIKNLEKVCIKKNLELKEGPFLYICGGPDIEVKDNVKYKRLPQFGLKYQDPDEETYIDTLKKEYNVND